MEDKTRKIKKTMMIMQWVDAVILIPCFVVSVSKLLLALTLIDIFEIQLFNQIFGFFAILYIVPLMLFIVGRCFFLPEILFGFSIILQIIYFILARKSKLPITRTAVMCAVLDIFCVIALLSAQTVFDGAMSV